MMNETAKAKGYKMSNEVIYNGKKGKFVDRKEHKHGPMGESVIHSGREFVPSGGDESEFQLIVKEKQSIYLGGRSGYRYSIYKSEGIKNIKVGSSFIASDANSISDQACVDHWNTEGQFNN